MPRKRQNVIDSVDFVGKIRVILDTRMIRIIEETPEVHSDKRKPREKKYREKREKTNKKRKREKKERKKREKERKREKKREKEKKIESKR